MGSRYQVDPAYADGGDAMMMFGAVPWRIFETC